MKELFKSFFARIGTFIINTVKKVGKFIADHFNPTFKIYESTSNFIPHFVVDAIGIIALNIITPKTTTGMMIGAIISLGYIGILFSQTIHSNYGSFSGAWKFIKNHYNPMYNSITSEDYIEHGIHTFEVYALYGLIYHFAPQCLIIGKALMIIELVSLALTAIVAIYQSTKEREVIENV